MSVLPRTIPARYTDELRAALTAAGVAFDPTIKPGSRITYSVTHQGRTWDLRYVLPAVWKLIGPPGSGYEWGPGVTAPEAVAAITAPVPVPEPVPVDPYPGAPRTHIGVPVPEMVRAAWTTPRADWWRLGVRSAVAAR
ncbi:hypothetical protein AB0O57_29650 [Streptomyces sp. NPDC091201]|uniref:hypothetical protein n=1 Tax=Streptomyces sp. NPDC091201 TaxID=3155190 RepID=UPI003444B9F1